MQFSSIAESLLCLGSCTLSSQGFNALSRVCPESSGCAHGSGRGYAKESTPCQVLSTRSDGLPEKCTSRRFTRGVELVAGTRGAVVTSHPCWWRGHRLKYELFGAGYARWRWSCRWCHGTQVDGVCGAGGAYRGSSQLRPSMRGGGGALLRVGVAAGGRVLRLERRALTENRDAFVLRCSGLIFPSSVD